jgi:hypothetical protein
MRVQRSGGDAADTHPANNASLASSILDYIGSRMCIAIPDANAQS